MRKQFFQPLFAVTISRLASVKPENIRVFVARGSYRFAICRAARVGRNDYVGSLQSRKVESFAGRGADHTVFPVDIQKRNMFIVAVNEVAVDFVRAHEYAVFSCDLCNAVEFVFRINPSHRVMRIAKQHKFHFSSTIFFSRSVKFIEYLPSEYTSGLLMSFLLLFLIAFRNG